jgi:hypothetical protein
VIANTRHLFNPIPALACELPQSKARKGACHMVLAMIFAAWLAVCLVLSFIETPPFRLKAKDRPRPANRVGREAREPGIIAGTAQV